MPLKTDDIREIFLQAIELPSPEERAAFLDEACAGNEAARGRVEALLLAHERPESLLDRPAVASDGDALCAPTVNQPFTAVSEIPGDTIGPYKLLEQIGEGGFGVVFMAEQTAPVKRKVALKVIKPGMDTREVIARFEAERQALALMDHPNIAKVLDAGATETGRPYFVMELVRGVPITDYCDQAQLTPRERLELFVTVCQAVQHAHQKGIIHRDIKPSNVLVTQHDDRPVVKVIDFGIAKATSGQLTDKTLFTAFAQLVGTPLYMSPEQASLSAIDVDTRSDIYSLGVLLYELLTGTTPFDKARLQHAAFEEVRRIIREEEPLKPSTRLSSLGDTLPSVSAVRRMEPRKLSQLVRGELDWIVMKALEKDRARRYETANGFAADVLHYLADEPVLACPPSAGYRFKKFARRNKGALTTSAVIALVVLTAVGSIGWMVRDQEAQRQEMARQQAEREAEVARKQAEREAEIARERNERQTRLTAQVEVILDEVERLVQEGKWDDALSAARRAESVLDSGDADATIQERVRQAVNELEMVHRLDQIWMDREALQDGNFDHARTIDAYAQAFRQFGVDIQSLPTTEAITRLGAHRRIALPLAAALDTWGSARRDAFGMDEPGWRPLAAVAQGLDPDPLRHQLRALLGRELTPELHAELRTLVEGLDVRREAPGTLVELASILGSARLVELQERVLRQAQQAHPGDVWLNMDLGNFLRKRKNNEEAIRFYSTAVGVRPTFPAAHTNLGTALHHKGLTDEAIAAYREAIHLRPDFAAAHNGLGNALRYKGLTDEAIAAYREAIRLQPDNALAHTNIGAALSDKGLADEAITACREAVRLQPDFAGAYYNLGQALSSKGLTDEAIAAWREAIRLDPGYAAAHGNLGIALRDKGLTDEAIAAQREAVRLTPEDADAHVHLGVLLCDDKRDYDGAIAAFREAIRLKAGSASAHDYTCLGVALRNKGSLDEAIAACQEAVRLDPGYPAAHDNLGNALHQQHKLDEAIVCYRKAIDLGLKDAGTYYNLGNAHFQKGQQDEAIAAYREAIRIKPDLAEAHNNLGGALLGQGLTDEAIAAFREAIRFNPDLVQALNNLGNALYEKGLTDEAIAAWREAIRLHPDDARAHTHLGNVLSNKGLTDEAIAAYTKAIECDPKNASAHNSLAWLLANAPDPKFRNPARAVELAMRAVELSPSAGEYWNTLGAAHYRAGDWNASTAALERSMQLRNGGDSFDWFLLAMTHQQLGNQDEARQWYDRAVEWMENNRPDDEELRGFRTEAATLLGIPDPSTPEEPLDADLTPES